MSLCNPISFLRSKVEDVKDYVKCVDIMSKSTREVLYRGYFSNVNTELDDIPSHEEFFEDLRVNFNKEEEKYFHDLAEKILSISLITEPLDNIIQLVLDDNLFSYILEYYDFKYNDSDFRYKCNEALFNFDMYYKGSIYKIGKELAFYYDFVEYDNIEFILTKELCDVYSKEYLYQQLKREFYKYMLFNDKSKLDLTKAYLHFHMEVLDEKT